MVAAELSARQPFPGRYYRAVVDSDESNSEFVFFVGWNATNTRLIFEDGNGDVYVFRTDEVEVAS
jgi:hypothetical protein